MTRKLLLCRPAGGLNDMLCQIGKAIRYGRKYNRRVIIDTRAGSFRDNLSYYFESKSDSIVLPDEAALLELNFCEVFPSFLMGNLNTYSAVWSSEVGSFVESSTRKPISFDFKKDYVEKLLVHHNCGGGTDSIYAIQRFKLREHIRKSLLERLGVIGGTYHGIHIRHSDYKTYYKEAIAAIKNDVDSRLFVATDNSEVLSYCKSVFGQQRVYSFSHFFSTTETPLHNRIMNVDDTRQRNVDAILDVLMLALARKLYTFPIELNSIKPIYSGFSMLAENISQRPTILYSLTGKINYEKFLRHSFNRLSKNLRRFRTGNLCTHPL